MARLYVAGPLGFSEAGRSFSKHELTPLLRGLGHELLDPWALADAAALERVRTMPEGAARRQAWARLNADIAEANRRAIERADGLVAVLDGADVDSGTAAEIGYAFARRKKIVGYRGDLRPAGDNEGAVVNLQVEYFVRASGGTIVDTLPALADAVRAAFP